MGDEQLQAKLREKQGGQDQAEQPNGIEGQGSIRRKGGSPENEGHLQPVAEGGDEPPGRQQGQPSAHEGPVGAVRLQGDR